MINFLSHFNELKLKLVYILVSLFFTFLTTYVLISDIVYIVTEPAIEFFKEGDSSFVFTNIFEAFNTNITLAFYITLFFCIPVILYFLTSFLKPGLFVYEKNLLFFCVSVIIINLCLSVLFTFFIIIPAILSFFLSLELTDVSSSINLRIQLKLFDYVTTICQFLFVYGFFVFQLPGVVYIFVYLREPKPNLFYQKRRFFILIFLVIGCIFSSPDMWCLFVISIPLTILFELTIFSSILKNKYKRLS